jgi:hypothetical protein
LHLCFAVRFHLGDYLRQDQSLVHAWQELFR